MWRSAVLWLAAVSSVVYLTLGLVGLASGSASVNTVLWVVISGPPVVAAAGYLLWRRPANPIGPLLMLVALTGIVLPTILELATVLRSQSVGSESWMWAPIWAAQTLQLVGTVVAAAILALLPDGQAPLSYRRLFLGTAAVIGIQPTLGLLTNELVHGYTYQFHGIRDVASPIFIPALGSFGPAVTVAGFLANLVLVLGIAALFVRYRRSSLRDRRRLRWVLLAGVVTLAVTIVPALLGQLGLVPALQDDLVSLITFVPAVLIPWAIVAAVMEPPWIDVDFIIRRSLVYGTLSLLILAIYAGGAAVIGLAAGSELPIGMAIVLTVLVAIALQPVRERLQRWADRWVFGARPRRYLALAEFGERVDDVTDPVELVGRLAATAHQALRLTWTTATIDGIGTRTVGRRDGQAVLELEIRHRGETIGRLECGAPANGKLDPDDVMLLRALSGQAGLAISNARLVTRIVDAQEEERRRIERDLHDGAQQELVALIARLALAQSRLEAGTLDLAALDELKVAVRRILADIRELAQGIHPSIVADGGILAAVEERCANLPLDVRLDAEPSLRRARFPAKVEGAAYFLVAEGLANVLKHARATRATVTLARRDGRLSVSVADDGTGFDPAVTLLRGLAGLEDRVTALGGSVRVTSRPGQGTRIAASLPLEP